MSRAELDGVDSLLGGNSKSYTPRGGLQNDGVRPVLREESTKKHRTREGCEVGHWFPRSNCEQHRCTRNDLSYPAKANWLPIYSLTHW